MKALSIRQPWLWAILGIPEGDCPKRVENRKGTAFNYRGPVLLHASAGGTRREFFEAAAVIRQAHADHGVEFGAVPEPVGLPRSCFLGIALIVGVDVHPTTFGGRPTSGYRIAGQLGLNLADVRKLPPVPARGALGLYGVKHVHRPLKASPNWIDFGEHRDVYAAAWADLSAKGGAA